MFRHITVSTFRKLCGTSAPFGLLLISPVIQTQSNESLGMVKPLQTAHGQENIKDFGDLDPASKELIQAAIEARKFAYTPYSNFKVGAAFRTKSGCIYSGCNVENAAFGPSCCAERTAICKAVSEGHTEFVAGAVVAFQEDAFTTPCGVCRQVIMEFTNADIPIYVARDSDGVRDSDPVLCTSIYNLLPSAFKSFKR